MAVSWEKRLGSFLYEITYAIRLEGRMEGKTFSKLSLIILISFLFVSYAVAQAGRGRARIGGVVEDKEGNSMKSAKIVIHLLKNEEVKRETTTDKKGIWSIIGLSTGDWRVTASADGYYAVYVDIYVRQLERMPKITLTLKKIEQYDKPTIENETSLNLIERANQLYDERKYDEALVSYEQFLEENPNVYHVHLSIGNCYREKEELDKALEKYNRVLEQAKNDDLMGKKMAAKALAGIGECYMSKEDFEEAQNFFKQSIENYPENEILAYNVGEIYFSNQKIEEAIHYFELAIQIEPKWSDPYLKLGYVYLNRADNAKAVENFEKFLKLEPDSERSLSVKNIIDYLKKR